MSPSPATFLRPASEARAVCLAIALACAAILGTWQALTVHYNYGGNWTALFCTGALYPAPPAALAAEHIYRFPASYGYDGQSYHYIAHDPFFRRGFAASMDAPRFRYRRILVSGLAFLLALGQDPAIDPAYRLVVLAFVFLGAYWLARLAQAQGRTAAWGLLFAAVPAVLISADRLTTDGALAACCVGFAWYARQRCSAGLYTVLAAAALVRETGLVLVAAYVVYLLGTRALRAAALFATAAAPTAAWYAFVQVHTASFSLPLLSPIPLLGFARRVVHPFPYPFSALISGCAIGLDFLALAGVAGGLCWVVYRAGRRAWTPVTVALYVFAVLTAALSNAEVWSEVYAFGRSLAPLLVLGTVDGLEVGSLVPCFLMLACDPRIGLQWGSQILHVVRGI